MIATLFSMPGTTCMLMRSAVVMMDHAPFLVALGWSATVIVLMAQPKRQRVVRRFDEASPDLPDRSTTPARGGVAVAMSGLIGWLVGGGVGAALAVVTQRWVRRQHRRRAERIEQELSEQAVIEWFDVAALSAQAGVSLALSLSNARPMMAGRALEWVDSFERALERGSSTDDALRNTVSGSPSGVRRVVDDVVAAHRAGTSLPNALRRGSTQVNEAIWARRSERARRLPIALLGPLIVCILPAVCLMAVVPMVVRLVAPS